MALDFKKLLKDMLVIAKQILGEAWPDVEVYVTAELQGITDRILWIQRELLAGRITQQKAKLMFDLQSKNTKIVLITAAGLSELGAEKLLTAIFKTIANAVNEALGWVLISLI